jgi:hypothetical protein
VLRFLQAATIDQSFNPLSRNQQLTDDINLIGGRLLGKHIGDSVYMNGLTSGDWLLPDLNAGLEIAIPAIWPSEQ